MQLRRALLLFAVVLGLAAIATSVSRPPEDDEGSQRQPPPASTPVASPGPGPATVREITFRPAAKPPTETLQTGEPASVLVEVDEPGLVEIEDLGLSAFAEPLTPARFEVLTSDEGTVAITLRPVRSGEPGTVGRLRVEPAETGR